MTEESNIKHQPAKGHEVPIASMIRRRAKIRIMTIRGAIYVGFVQSFDKFSVTIREWVRVDRSSQVVKAPRTFFKHALESFEEHKEDQEYV